MSRMTPIYLDYQATTPLDPEVREAMLPYLDERFGNPHSDHLLGWQAAEAVDEACLAVAALIGSDPGEVVLTSGATEANNIAILGVAKHMNRRHIITSSIEHKSVLEPLEMLARQGWKVEKLPVNDSGVLNINLIAGAIRPETGIISVMAANNEIGTLQPIYEIGALCAQAGIIFHCDAAQIIGKQSLDVVDCNIDLLSLSAHKFYGPKGIGALVIASNIRDQVAPIFFGGGQQGGIRPGTLSPLLCAGLARAARIATERLNNDEAHTAALRQRLLRALSEELPSFMINGSPRHSLSGCVNICIPGVDAHSMLSMLQTKIAASQGSACNAGLFEGSHVLSAIGLSKELSNCSIRIGFGRFTTEEDIDEAVRLIKKKSIELHQNLAAE